MRFIAVLLMCAGLALLDGCRRQEESVARVGEQTITKEEFRVRYKNYLSGTQQRDNILLRKQVLGNMMNEVLIHADIRRQRFDSDSEAVEALRTIDEKNLLNGYGRKITVDTMRITEPELQDEFRSSLSRAAVRYVYGHTYEEAVVLRRRLEAGETFEELAKRVFEDPGLANNGGYLGLIAYGEMDPALEQAAFHLPVGVLSDPIKIAAGYAIIRVEKRVQQPLASEDDYRKVRDKLGTAILERKVMNVLTNASRKAADELGPRFHDDVVKTVFARWNDFIAQPARVLASSREATSPVLDPSVPIVEFRNGSWSLQQFIDRMSRIPVKQSRHVRSEDDLRDFIRGLATHELLLERAKEAGMETDTAVVRQSGQEKERYLLQRWAKSVQDTVGQLGWDEAVLRKAYEETKGNYALPPEVNVAEILVRTEAEATSILKRLKAGSDFADLARRKSIRLWAAKKGGELGFGTESSYGVLGKKIMAAKVGDTLGPEYVDPYYGVFRILARREGRLQSFDEARQSVIGNVAGMRKLEVFKAAVAALGKGVSTEVNEQVLENISVK